MCVLLSEANIVRIRDSSYFLIGLVLGQSGQRRLSVPLAQPFLAGSLLLGFSILGSAGIYRQLSAYEIAWCLSLFHLLWSLADRCENSLVVGVFAWLGRNSLSVLLLHTLALLLMRPFNGVFLYVDSTGVLHSVVVTVVALAFCLLASRICDSLGISRFLFGVRKFYSSFGT